MCLVVKGQEAKLSASTARSALHIPKVGLQVGDPIPDELWDMPLEVVNHPDGKEMIKLADYKGKLIILDFWASWCTPCIAAFPKGDSIQRQFGDDAQVLLVNSIKGTGDKKEKIDFIMANRKNPDGNRYVMPSVVEDTALKKAFPHKVIPHYVWLSGKGNVLAISNKIEPQSKDISKILQGELYAFERTTQILAIDPYKVLIDTKDDLDESPKVLKGKISRKLPYYNQSYGMVNTTQQNENDYDKVYYANFPLFQILTTSLGIDFIPRNRVFINGKQLIDDDIDPLIKDSLYCYELSLDSPVTADSIRSIVRKDIEMLSGYIASRTEIVADTYVLLLNDSANVRKSEGGIADNNILDAGSGEKYISNQTVAALVVSLNQSWPTPVLNETEYDEPVDLLLPSDLTDIQALNQALLQQGFELRKERREWDILEINKTIL